MYIPHSEEDIKFLLKETGLKNLEDVYSHISDIGKYKLKEIDIPKLPENEILDFFRSCSKLNLDLQDKKIFLGGGIYYHYIPAVVDYLSSRAEFVTPYTPYQPEASQGCLQAFYDFQSLIGRLTGYKAVTLGHYDCATALAEIIVIVSKLKKISKVAVSPFLNPYVKEVINTYTSLVDIEFIEMPKKDFGVDTDSLEEFLLSSQAKIVVLQQPNFFGFLEDAQQISKIAKKQAITSIFVNLDPTYLGLFIPPATLGFDIAILEGQPFGLYPNFGGPLLGIIAASEEFLRYLPGRLVGKTIDANNNVAYTLTLQTREQHIRREKSFSNICTNQGVMAIRVAIYLAAMGMEGLQKIAKISYDYSHYAYENLLQTQKVEKVSNRDFYNEFTVKAKFNIQEFNKALLEKNIVGGLEIKNGENNFYLLTFTELLNKEAIDTLINMCAQQKTI